MKKELTVSLLVALLSSPMPLVVNAQEPLPYHKANTATSNRKQIRALTPKGIPNSDLPALAEKLAGTYKGDFFLVGFFDTKEAVDRFQGNGGLNSEVEEMAWRCDVRVDRGHSDGTCKSWGGENLASRNISGSELFLERGNSWK